MEYSGNGQSRNVEWLMDECMPECGKWIMRRLLEDRMLMVTRLKDFNGMVRTLKKISLMEKMGKVEPMDDLSHLLMNDQTGS